MAQGQNNDRIARHRWRLDPTQALPALLGLVDDDTAARGRINVPHLILAQTDIAHQYDSGLRC